MKKEQIFRRLINERIFLVIFILPFIFNCTIANELQSGNKKVSPLVSGSWLAENLSKPDVVILHVTTTRPEYDNGHIPGARFLWPGYIIKSTEKESTVPAPLEDVTKLLRSLGVNNDSHVILCGANGNIVTVCRVFVSLEHVGLKGRVSILDGGFDEWKAAGSKISTETPVVNKGKFTPVLNENLVDITFVQKSLKDNSFSIIDARSKSQYEGATGGSRAGHIPGAKNLPQSELYDGKTYVFMDAEKMGQAFKNLQIPSGSRPVFYCNSGNSASVDYVAALIAGYDPIVYDGSMEEWGSRLDLPVEKK